MFARRVAGYLAQHRLYFRPLPHGHGPLRLGPAAGTWSRWPPSNWTTSLTSSGLSGSTPTTTFHPRSSQRLTISWALGKLWTRALAGCASLPRRATGAPP